MTRSRGTAAGPHAPQTPSEAVAEPAAVVDVVDVEVMVNHEQLRRGDRGEVELTGRAQAMIDKGYLHVHGVVRQD